MNMPTKTLSVFFAATFALIATNTPVADDTEIYLKQVSLPPEQARPNVVFVLDSSGSMGLPVDPANGTSSFREDNNYDSSVTYPGDANNSGGVGDSNYYYLYARPNTYADQYIYFNKVHSNQMLCDMSTVHDSTPYETSTDRYIFNTGATWNASSGGSNNNSSASDPMCAEHDQSCGFTAGPAGPLVDCKSEENRVTDNNRYPSDNENNRFYAVSANYHNYLQGYYRYTVLLKVMKDLIDEDYDINATMMRFNGGNGGYVFHESILAEDAADPTDANQQSLRDALDDIYEFDDNTPLTETLWEAYRYLAGHSADFGNDSGTNTPSAAYTSGTTYNSPIDYSCQKSHIIVLTDGAPTSDTNRDSSIESNSYTGSNCSGNCLDEFAEWIHMDDSTVPPTIRDHSSSLLADQQIAVHTIGFGSATDATLLQNAANNGGGLYKAAANAAQLSVAFDSILDQIEFEKDTFVAPAVAVNAYNGLQHREELYFALFQPTASPRWNGNIKKYRLENGVIVDVNDNDAIDDGGSGELNTGYFKDSALSIWSTLTDWDNSGNGAEADGSDIEYGGFAYELTDPDARKIYTYISTAAPNSVAISGEEVSNSNINITTNMLGLGASSAATEAERTAILNWSKGYDGAPGSNTPNYYVGDLIHNQPSVVTYYTDSTDPDNPVFDDAIYAASNMGLLHAIDADDGSEHYAFIPQELLSNLTTYYQDSGGFSDKIYGLDAPMTIWANDNDGDGSLVTFAGGNTPDTDTAGNKDHVYLYQAMRRGGKNIYAMDVTSRSNPKLLWQIIGGPGGTPGFEKLGQTWSVPQRGKVLLGTTETEVLFFGGGYDVAHDSAATPTSGDEGAGLYMVNATTGALIWSVNNTSLGFAGMDNSIAANVTAADVDGDGNTDFLFAVDIQGTVWRIDFPETSTGQANFVANVGGGAIAELGGTGSDFRRFYNAPDVAYFASRGNDSFLTISVSSGYRADPRETTINDRLFVMFDTHALTVPSNYNYVGGSNPVKPANLPLLPAVAGTHGWSLALGNASTGEKGLSRTITFNDQIIMTTYVPGGTTCEGSTGSGKFYLLDALSGKSRLEDDSGNIVPFNNLTHGGIPPEPAIIFGVKDVCVENCNDGDDTNDVTEEQSDLVVCVGTECINDAIDLTLHKTYWREN